MYLFFDTETTGLPRNWKAPISDSANWPRMVQLAWAMFNDEGQLLNEYDYIIYPEGYRIPSSSARVHGITTEGALVEGSDLSEVLEHFSRDVKTVNYIVAHNISFDEKIVGAELIRKGFPDVFFMKNRICTMKASTNFCKITGKYGYKWPSLTELHESIFGKGFEDAHDAAVDIRMTAKCFWALRNLGVL